MTMYQNYYEQCLEDELRDLASGETLLDERHVKLKKLQKQLAKPIVDDRVYDAQDRNFEISETDKSYRVRDDLDRIYFIKKDKLGVGQGKRATLELEFGSWRRRRLVDEVSTTRQGICFFENCITERKRNLLNHGVACSDCNIEFYNELRRRIRSQESDELDWKVFGF